MTKDEEIAELKQLLTLAQQQKTLRDEFAMTALLGMLNRNTATYNTNCEIAYKCADIMMEARKWPTN
jgi:hypothetical protein